MGIQEKELTAIGSYIFAGGFTIGVEKSFKVLAHLEGGDYGVNTFKLNRPNVPVHYPQKEWPVEKFAGVNFIYCNPPCAPFSVVGKSIYNGKDNWRTDPRMSCHDHCFGLFEKLSPDAYAIESVPAAFTRGRELFDRRAEEAMARGYSVTHLLEDARWFGLPQKRSRYMFIAHRHELRFGGSNWAPPPALLEVLASVPSPGLSPEMKPEKVELVRRTPQGTSVRGAWHAMNPDESKWVRGPGGVKGRPRFCEYRSRPDLTGAFIGNFIIHPTEDRYLGVEECKVLCGFPPEWKFWKERKAFSEIARGVMPPVAEWVGRVVATGIREAVPAVPGVQIVDLRQPPKINDI